MAACVNNTIHFYLGQRGIAILGPGLHIVAFACAALHPPYAILVAICMLAGLGSGLIDAGWNAWIGAMENSNGIMGLLQSCYGLGAALVPVIATSITTTRGRPWYEFYYLMTLLAIVELCTSTAAFWSATGASYRLTHQADPLLDTAAVGYQPESRQAADKRGNALLQALGNVSTWLISLFIFVYAGIEISLADWIFTVLVDVRHNSPYAGSMVTFGYWGGITLGRILIGFLASYFQTGKATVTACLVMSVAMHLLFSLKTDLVTSAISTALLGFFLGPLFPEAVVMQTRLVHKRLHVAAVGFACALGSAGGCVFPFTIGAIAQVKGIQILHPTVLAMLMLCLACWLALRNPSRLE
ncbi:MAG: hypothetical protein Q9164_007323 [Protoblastenia rupestris]